MKYRYIHIVLGTIVAALALLSLSFMLISLVQGGVYADEHGTDGYIPTSDLVKLFGSAMLLITSFIYAVYHYRRS